MFKAYVIATALVLNFSHLVSAQLPDKKKAFEDPEKVIVDAIKLLESKDHSGFVKRFYSPRGCCKTPFWQQISLCFPARKGFCNSL